MNRAENGPDPWPTVRGSGSAGGSSNLGLKRWAAALVSGEVLVAALIFGGGMSLFLQLWDTPPCLMVQTQPRSCLDERMTGSAEGTVVAIRDGDDGIPQWVVQFTADGQHVEGTVPDWPEPAAPAIGQSVSLAYDPAAPAQRVTSAAALADYRARAESADGLNPQRWLITAALLAGLYAVVWAWLVSIRRARTS